MMKGIRVAIFLRLTDKAERAAPPGAALPQFKTRKNKKYAFLLNNELSL